MWNRDEMVNQAERVKRARTARRVGTALTVVAALGLGGCGVAAMWGNVLVLCVTLGIFVGTLTLGRSARPSDATRSTAESTHSRF